MRIAGRVFKDGKWWLAEMPQLDGMTQGRTRKAALAMAADWIACMADRPRLSVSVADEGGDSFTATVDDHDAVLALVERCRRDC